MRQKKSHPSHPDEVVEGQITEQKDKSSDSDIQLLRRDKMMTPDVH